MAVRTFSVGDPVPGFACPTVGQPRFHFDTTAGRYLVLSFFGSAAIANSAQVLQHVTTTLRTYFDDVTVAFFGVTVDRTDEVSQRIQQSLPGIRYFLDFDRQVSTLYGAVDPQQADSGGAGRYRPFTLVLDPSMRVLFNIPLIPASQHNEALGRILAGLPPVSHHAGGPIPAPILILPRVFEPQFCRSLVDLYEKHGGEESGFMRQMDGKTVGIYDHTFKKRKDFYFDKSEEFEPLRASVRTRVLRRLVPEIVKAFQFHVTHMERYVVACYEGNRGGFFRAHRDNNTQGTLHRCFACTINLNAEDYEGGNLRFPEFGPQTYRAPTGGAVVFSCSLLHEALPVTQGTRYAFLPFLYNEAKAKVRAENAKFIAKETLDFNSGTGDAAGAEVATVES